jgi:exodeoxyribonuclease-5
MNWSPQQSDALLRIARWHSSRTAPQVFRCFGFAGTGKSTIAKQIAADITGDVQFAAYTGKAALVMRSKGCTGARTVHSLIYRVRDKETRQPGFELNPDSDVRDCALVIIDECSMIDEQLGRDLLSFGKKVLVLGDPAQLPPVKGQGFFTNAEPDVMLTEIHRQAAESPIIRMATDVREGRRLEYGEFGSCRVIPRSAVVRGDVLKADQVLCGLNATRRTMNRRIRELLGFTGKHPAVGDRLVCLRNNREKNLLNGSLWTCEASARGKKTIDMTVKSLDDADAGPVEVSVPVEFFEGRDQELNWQYRRKIDEFDFGMALTVHKSQGSQWNSVALFDESGSFREDACKWLYTGLTRAADRVTVVMS